MSILSSVIMIIVGLVVCFLGKKYVKVILGLQAGVIAFYITARALTGMGQPELVVLIGAIAVGLIVGFIAYQFLYKWVFIIFGALLGVAIVGIIEAALGIQGILVPILATVGAIIGGLLGNQVASLIVEFSTSISGSAITVGGVAALSAAVGIGLPLVDPYSLSTASANSIAVILTIVATIILAALGFSFQRSSSG